jgi:hypothetical protein
VRLSGLKQDKFIIVQSVHEKSRTVLSRLNQNVGRAMCSFPEDQREKLLP